MNRPRNRQQPNDVPGKHAGSRATPQQAAGTVPTARQVVPGAAVFIVIKEDQPSGEETAGVVQNVLTRGNHPRGVKVRLRGGMVGRVQRMNAEAGTESAATAASAGSVGNGHANAGSSMALCRDIRLEGLDGYPAEPPERTLADFMPVWNEGLQSSRQGSPRPENQQEMATCPICEGFQGDEAAVTHHIERDHFS